MFPQKMIMAERAADCLAKLGLDPAPVQPEKMGAPDGPSTSSPRSAPHGNVLCGGGTGPNQLFGAPHHRRSVLIEWTTQIGEFVADLKVCVSGPGWTSGWSDCRVDHRSGNRHCLGQSSNADSPNGADPSKWPISLVRLKLHCSQLIIVQSMSA